MTSILVKLMLISTNNETDKAKHCSPENNMGLGEPSPSLGRNLLLWSDLNSRDKALPQVRKK